MQKYLIAGLLVAGVRRGWTTLIAVSAVVTSAMLRTWLVRLEAM